MIQEQQSQINSEDGGEKSVEVIKVEKTPAEKRGARFHEIDSELKTFNISEIESLEELEARRNQEFENKIQEMNGAGIPINKDTKKLIYKNMVADLIEHAGKENERFDKLKAERKQLERDSLEDDFLEKIGELQVGVNIDEFKKIISSPAILDLDRHVNRQKIEINEENWDILWKKGSKDLTAMFGKLLRMELANSQYAEMLADSTVDFAKSEERNILGQVVDLEKISDSEIVELGSLEIKNIIKKMLADPESKVFQGNFSNVLVSEESPYVLKTMRKMEDEVDDKKQEQAFFSHSIFRETFGAEFLPRWAVLKSQANGKVYILQEKQDFKKSEVLKNGTVDELIESKEFGKIFEKRENKDKLERFLAGIENLYVKHQFVLDILGDNVFISVDDAGNLDIKLIDYGGWQNDAENRWGDDFKVVQEFIEKLKSRLM